MLLETEPTEEEAKGLDPNGKHPNLSTNFFIPVQMGEHLTYHLLLLQTSD